jgi:CAI-1 autoinducer synthase
MRQPRWFAEQLQRQATALDLSSLPLAGTPNGGLRLDQNDYLRLSGHPAVRAARSAVNESEDTEPPAASVFAGSPEEALLTTMLCRVLSAPDALVTSAGWTANVGLLEAITAPSRPVYIDRQAHPSLYDGTRLVGAHRVGVRHNNPGALERKVRHGGPGIVCIEAIHGGDGTLADLEAFVEVCERFACVLVLDEAHSFAMLGRDGGGLAVELGLADRVHFRTGSLSKALGGHGGFVAAAMPGTLDAVAAHMGPLVFSSPTSPILHGGHAAALRVMCAEPERAARCVAHGARLARALRVAGFDVGGHHHIVAVRFSDDSAWRVFGALRDEGVLASVLVYPSAPGTLLRFAIHADVTSADVDRLAALTIAAVERLAPASVLRGGRAANAA